MSRKYGCLFHNGRKNVILYYPTENKGESRMKKLIAILCVVVLAASAVIGVTSVRSSNKIKELNEDISAMQEAVTESQKNVDALTETVAAKDTEIETLTADVAEKAKAIEALTADVAEKQGEIEALTADVAEKNAQIAVLSETVEAHAGEITALNEQVAAAQTQIDALTADLTGAQDKLQQIIDTINGTKGASALPAVGDTVNGFEVKEIRDFPLIGAKLVLFEHRNTGAKLFYVANADTNRAFQIVFPTRPLDNTGLPHVFEHATLFGSDKYPATSLYFNVAYQTYNTYINAHTTDACTWYPLASLSEEQLLHLADYYIDACFHPLIMHDESIFKTQAWHYNLPDIDGELTYEGVVYSEMQGAMTLERKGLMYANSLTFPGSVLALDEGGLPEDIPNMTWEDVKGYHDKFYHPSNSITYLYGQIADYAAFLALLDEAFTGYEKAEFTFEDAGYTPITEAAVGEYAHPMTEGTDVANQSVIYYYILCPGMKGDTAQESLIDHVCSLLNMEASALTQRFRKAFPAGSVSCGREVAGPDDAILFTASGVNRGDAEAFKALVDEALRDVAQNGFPQEMVDAAMTSLSISAKLAPENGDPVQGVLYSFTYDYAVTGDPFAYAESVDALDKIDGENRDGLLKDAAARWLADKELYTLTTAYPAPGEKEKADAALKEKLAEIKASMTAEELQAIVEETNAAPKDEDVSALMAQIKAVTVESLPEEIRTYAVSDSTDENGIRHIEATAGVDGIGFPYLLLDASTLPQEDIHWMRLFTRLLGKLDTDRHTREELDVLMGRYLYDKTIGVAAIEKSDNTIHPYLVASWYALDDDLETGYGLMEELLFHTRFDDAEKLAEQVQAQKTAVRATINNNAYEIMLYRGLADQYPFYRYFNYMNFLDYYAFLESLETMLNEQPEEVTKRFEAVQAFFRNNAGAVAAFAGNEQSIALNRPLADAFLAKLEHVEREAAAYDLPVPSQREALIIDGNVQFNNLIATANDIGLEDFDAGLGAVCSLVSDKLLVPILRDRMGVYTPLNGIMDNGSMYLVSYRDPNVKETFDVYASLADQIAAMDVDQETLDGYIMSAYSGIAKPAGELTGAISAIEDKLKEEDPERFLGYMRRLKAVTPEFVKACAENYRKAWENGVHNTAGSAAAINANAELYDAILNPFQAKDNSQVTLNDIAEGDAYYEAVRYVFEHGLMQAKAEDAFGVTDDAAVGDWALAVYQMLGGAGSAEDATAALAQIGMLPPNAAADTILTRTDLVGSCNILCQMAGVKDFDASLPESDAENASRGDVAILVMRLDTTE